MNSGCRWRVAGFGLVICLLTLALPCWQPGPRSPNQLQVVRVHSGRTSSPRLSEKSSRPSKGFRLF
jgi:hypothetical protein